MWQEPKLILQHWWMKYSSRCRCYVPTKAEPKIRNARSRIGWFKNAVAYRQKNILRLTPAEYASALATRKKAEDSEWIYTGPDSNKWTMFDVHATLADKEARARSLKTCALATRPALHCWSEKNHCLRIGHHVFAPPPSDYFDTSANWD